MHARVKRGSRNPCLMGLIHLERLGVARTTSYLEVLGGVVALLVFVTSAKLWRHDCFESRFVAVLVCGGAPRSALCSVSPSGCTQGRHMRPGRRCSGSVLVSS